MPFRILAVVFSTSVLISIGIVTTILLTKSSSPTDEILQEMGSERSDYHTAESLILASELIVLAEFIDEAYETIHPVSPVTGSSSGIREDILRSYRIVETIKGQENYNNTLIVWDTKYVSIDAAGNAKRFEESYEILPAEKGKTYVLFLRS